MASQPPSFILDVRQSLRAVAYDDLRPECFVDISPALPIESTPTSLSTPDVVTSYPLLPLLVKVPHISVITLSR
ncbi:MAG: hypothetical protein WEC37_03970 [Anaerolineales bacterium]